MSASSHHAELSTLRAQLEELAGRLVAVADRYRDTPDSQIATDLYATERLVISARRSLDRALAALEGLG
jgi:hypothetical protein